MLSLMRLWFLGAALVPTLLFAQGPPPGGGGGSTQDPPGAYVPGPNEQMPYYFFGTYNIAKGRAIAYPPAPLGPPRYFTYGCLIVGGWGVRWFQYNPEDPICVNLTLGVVFDSTHFAPGTDVTVEIVAIDNYGTVYNTINSAPTKNRAIIYSHPEFSCWGGNGGLIADGLLSGVNYETHEQHDEWTALEHFSDMNVCNLVWVASHGFVNQYHAGNLPDVGDDTLRRCWTENTWDPTQQGWGLGYLQVRTTQTGGGLPPWNASHNPPINLLVLEVCALASDIRWAYALIPGVMWDWDTSVNQAVFAYHKFIRIIETEKRTTRIMGELAQGYTIGTVMVDLLWNAEEEDINCKESDGPGYEWRPLNQWGDVDIIGDQFTKIHTVYTGDNSPPSGWCLTLY